MPEQLSSASAIDREEIRRHILRLEELHRESLETLKMIYGLGTEALTRPDGMEIPIPTTIPTTPSLSELKLPILTGNVETKHRKRQLVIKHRSPTTITISPLAGIPLGPITTYKSGYQKHYKF